MIWMNTPARLAVSIVSAIAIMALSGCGQQEEAATPMHDSVPAARSEVTQDGISIAGAWLRPAPDGMAMTAGYGTITNHGDAADTLLSVSIAPAETVELHQSIRENGIASMRPVDGLTVMPGETITLMPGGYHLMLIGLTGPVTEGEVYEATLTFEKAGDIVVPMAATAMQNGAGSH